MMIMYPYDWIGGWAATHNLNLSKEAYTELADWMIRMDRINEEKISKLTT